MGASYFRSLARQNLANRWGKAALLYFLYSIICGAITTFCGCIPLIGMLAMAVVTPVFNYGFIKELLLFKNNKKTEYVDFLGFGFNNFGKIWSVQLQVLLKQLGPIILIASGLLVQILAPFGLLIGESVVYILTFIAYLLSFTGYIWLIPLSYKYTFVLYDLVIYPNMDSKELVKNSGDKMMGNRVKYFFLNLSFLGWILLSIFGCGIPLFWVYPYMLIAGIFFYESISNNSEDYNRAMNEYPQYNVMINVQPNIPNANVQQTPTINMDYNNPQNNPINMDQNNYNQQGYTSENNYNMNQFNNDYNVNNNNYGMSQNNPIDIQNNNQDDTFNNQ